MSDDEGNEDDQYLGEKPEGSNAVEDSGSFDQLFEEAKNQNMLLAKENRLLESYLHRKVGAEANWDEMQKEVNKLAGRHKRSEWTLNLYQKYNIALTEQDFRMKQLKALEVKAAEDINLLKAIIEGIKIRINEMRKETYEFKRDIVIGGENQQTGAIMAEKVIRYYEEKVKQKSALVEKIKLKNAGMKIARAKMDAQVKHREEQGDSLLSIDFHQLQIKNSQFNQKINERNAELLRLKVTTGKTIQVLTAAKQKLADLLLVSRNLKTDISSKREATVKLTEELEQVQSEVKAEQAKNKRFKQQQSNPDMPQVLDYVNQKSEMYDCDAEVKHWQRKLEITELAAKQARKVINAHEQKRPYSGPLSGVRGPPRPAGRGTATTGSLFPKVI